MLNNVRAFKKNVTSAELRDYKHILLEWKYHISGLDNINYKLKAYIQLIIQTRIY